MVLLRSSGRDFVSMLSVTADLDKDRNILPMFGLWTSILVLHCVFVLFRCVLMLHEADDEFHLTRHYFFSSF